MTLALTVVYKCTSNCGKNKSSETVNLGGRATLYDSIRRHHMRLYLFMDDPDDASLVPRPD